MTLQDYDLNLKPKNKKDPALFRIFKNYTYLGFSIMLSNILSSLHSLFIANGTDLEHKLFDACQTIKLKKVLIGDIDFNTNQYISNCTIKNILPTKIILDIVYISDDTVYVFEMKDGSDFDTEKSKSMVQKTKLCETLFSSYTNKKIVCKIVCFNLDDIKKASLKVSKEECNEYLMTGQDFCDIVNINMDEINTLRSFDNEENFKYLLRNLSHFLVDFINSHNDSFTNELKKIFKGIK